MHYAQHFNHGLIYLFVHFSEKSVISNNLMQPLYCKLCETRLNSPSQATAHYVGKSHLKKAKTYLKQSNETNTVTSQAEEAQNGIVDKVSTLGLLVTNELHFRNLNAIQAIVRKQ